VSSERQLLRQKMPSKNKKNRYIYDIFLFTRNPYYILLIHVFSHKNGVPVKTNIASPYSSAQKNSALLEKLKASNTKEKCNKQGF